MFVPCRRLFAAVLLAVSFSASRPAPAAPDAPSQFDLTILHDNDLHGHLLPFAYIEKGVGPGEIPSVGGAARRATLIRRLRKQIENPTVLVDSGDTFTRGPLATTYEGIADTEAMNAIGYDLAAVGNNEFKAKDGVDQNDAAGAQEALLQIVKRSRFPWICANAVDSRGAFLEGVQPYVVREIGGVRVGFLGLTAPRSAKYPQVKGWTISDPVAAAAKWIPQARAHCDILIAVTHIGVDLDKELAARTLGIDAIVGGDSHTYLYQPLEVANADGVKVPIVQDGEFGVRLGRFDLHFSRGTDGAWKLARYHDELLPVDRKIPEARDVADTIAPYVRPFETVVGHLDTLASTPDGRALQTTRVIVDAMRKQTGADYALHSAAGDGFFEVFRHKDVTRYDVYAVCPFHDDVVTATLTGAEIRDLLKEWPKSLVSGGPAHADPARTYRVAFVDYQVESEYKLPEGKARDTGLDLRQVVIGYLKSAGKK